VDISWPVTGEFKPRGIYLSCGSSSETGLPDGCMDFIVTDPPFFDNVHYSELADFFFAWQNLYPRGFINGAPTTRHALEVQDANADNFAAKLGAVFRECHRVLKDTGILVFTYHHSRAQGWTSLAKAVLGAGFSIVSAPPVKAEMSVAAPKSQAKEPIQLDVILVCKKREYDNRNSLDFAEALDIASKLAYQKQTQLQSIGLKLSQSDCRIIVISQFITAFGPTMTAETVIEALVNCEANLEKIVERLHVSASVEKTLKPKQKSTKPGQLTFSFNSHSSMKL
jgi:putative DNA methylase